MVVINAAQTSRKPKLCSGMKISLQMMLGVFSLAFVTLAYWGSIQQDKTWGSSAMTTSTTTSTIKSAWLKKRGRTVLCFGDSLTAGTLPTTNDKFPYALYLRNAMGLDFDSEYVHFSHKGFPGWTSSALLNEYPKVIAWFKKVEKRKWLHFERYQKREQEKMEKLGIQTPPQEQEQKQQQQQKQEEEEEEMPPVFEMVIVLAGTNDLAHGVSSEEIFESVKGIHELALAEGSTYTLALGIPPSAWQTHSEPARELAAAVNQKLEAWAQEEANQNKHYFLPFPIETYDPSSHLWSSDGLHLTYEGYKFLGHALAPTVAEILGIDPTDKNKKKYSEVSYDDPEDHSVSASEDTAAD